MKGEGVTGVQTISRLPTVAGNWLEDLQALRRNVQRYYW